MSLYQSGECRVIAALDEEFQQFSIRHPAGCLYCYEVADMIQHPV